MSLIGVLKKQQAFFAGNTHTPKVVFSHYAPYGLNLIISQNALHVYKIR